MNYEKFLESFSLTKNPVALGGCRNEGINFECCEHNITIFDNKDEKDSVVEFEGELVKIHHASLQETRYEILSQFSNMKILSDEQWELRILLSKIQEKKEKIFKTYAKSCLVEAAVCATKTKDGIKASDPFTSSWLKCSAYFVGDAILLANGKRISPAHMLKTIRGFEKNKINENLSVVNECIGIERATPSLLERMCKSTMGFSDMVEDNKNSKIIKNKYDYFIKNSLLTDCYFYLGYINRNNFIKIKDQLHRRPDYIHVLKTGFDLDSDLIKIEQQANLLHNTTNNMLTIMA